MGWYDAFKGNTAAVNMNGITSDTGSAFKNLGDAFGTIGRNMNEADERAKKDKLTNLQVQNEQMKLDTATETKAEAKVDKNYLKDAYTLDRTVSKEAQQNAIDALESFYNPTTTARDHLKDAWKTQDDVIQAKNNDNLNKISLSGDAKDIKTLKTLYPDDYAKANGAGLQTVNTNFNTNDTQASKLATAQSKVENAAEMLKLRGEINDVNAEKNLLKVDVAKKPKPIEFNKFVRDKAATEFNKQGERIITADNKKIIDYTATKGLEYIAAGYNENEAYDLATADYLKSLEVQRLQTNPLNVVKANGISIENNTTPKATSTIDANGYWKF